MRVIDSIHTSEEVEKITSDTVRLCHTGTQNGTSTTDDSQPGPWGQAQRAKENEVPHAAQQN